MKSGFVSIIGKPNTGKSTFINSFMNQKVSIVSDKPQTTRDQIRAIYNEKDLQIVFIDTPGYHKPNSKLDNVLNSRSLSSSKDSDLILYFSDGTRDFDEEEEHLLKNLKERNIPKILVITKSDASIDKKIENKVKILSENTKFVKVIIISSVTKSNFDLLKETITLYMQNNVAFYSTDSSSDQDEFFRIKEIIREKAISHLRQELPYSVAVEIEKTNYDEEKKIYFINASIILERPSHKKIVIGHNGSMIKKIGTDSRKELEELYSTKVFLELFVKIEDDWRNDDTKLSELGYKK